MTVKENLNREVKERVYNLETNHMELITRLDTLAKVGKIIAAMVAATLGFDLGIEDMV